MDSDQEIRPRTRNHRKTKEQNINNLDKVLDDVKTNEEKNTQDVKSESWGFESKLFIFIIALIVIGLIIAILWMVWRNDDNVFDPSKVPPGMNGTYIPSMYETKLAQQQAMQQQALYQQAMQQAQQTRQPQKTHDKEQLSVKNALKQRNNVHSEGSIKSKPIANDIGPVPGETLDNPDLFNKKKVVFKESKKPETIIEESIQEVNNEEEEDKRNFLDVAVLIGD
ncbi:MAG: hypothetical protein ACFFD1_11465 [Candidatus Thorarchaeota archaeon]